MTNPFRDQEKFMRSCDQTVEENNQQQYLMYVGLIEEESKEFDQALLDNDRVEQLDALIDILVVTIGALHSGGFDAEEACTDTYLDQFMPNGFVPNADLIKALLASGIIKQAD